MLITVLALLILKLEQQFDLILSIFSESYGNALLYGPLARLRKLIHKFKLTEKQLRR